MSKKNLNNLAYHLVDFFLMNDNEKDIYKIIKKKKLKIIFDVGCFQGKFTKKMLNIDNKKKNKSFFYLFDPNLNSSKYVKYLLQNNKNVRHFNIGLSNKIEEKIFYLNNFFEASGSSFQKLLKDDKLWNLSRRFVLKILNIFSFSKLPNFTSSKIKTNTIDNFCKLKKIDQIDLLKIDSEGHEEYILKGAEKKLKNNKINVIYTEVLGKKNMFHSKKNKIIKYLKKYHFELVKNYPITSVGFFSDLKATDMLFVNKLYKSK